MSSVPVVLRVKKRKLPPPAGEADAVGSADEAEAAVRLLLTPAAPAKRPRVAGAEDSTVTSSGHFFVYAGRVASAEAALAEAAVRRAIGKRKLDGEAERLRRRLGERPSEGEGRLIYKRRRRVDPTPVRPLAAPESIAAAAAAAADSAVSSGSRFRIVDFEAASGPRGACEEQIACNGVAMTATTAAVADNAGGGDGDNEEGVYYDVYYGYCDADLGGYGDGGSRQEGHQLRYLLQAYEEAYRYGDDPDDDAGNGGGFAVDDGGGDSDSNSESNWRNDYPDTPDGSSDGDESEADDDGDDVDPYDDHEVGGLARRLSSACVVDVSDDGDDEGGVGDDAAADLRDWRNFKQQLLQGSAASAQPQ